MLLGYGDRIGYSQTLTQPISRNPLVSEPLSALAFKVAYDKHRGLLVYVRLFSGILSEKSMLQNTTRNCKERVLKILQVSADNYTEIPSVVAGNIALLAGLKDTYTGDTLLSANDRIKARLAGIDIPTPVFACSIDAESASKEVCMAL